MVRGTLRRYSQVETKYRELFDIKSGYDGSILGREKPCGLLCDVANWEASDPTGKTIPDLLNEVRKRPRL